MIASLRTWIKHNEHINNRTIKSYNMRLIEFKAIDNNENEYEIFINPEHIESLYTLKSNNRIGIGLASGNRLRLLILLKRLLRN